MDGSYDRTDEDFWGDVPDWSSSARRRRDRGEHRTVDVTGGIKRIWSGLLDAGAHATREHRIVDATAPRPPEADRPRDEGFVDDGFGDDRSIDAWSVDDWPVDVDEGFGDDDRPVEPAITTTELPRVEAAVAPATSRIPGEVVELPTDEEWAHEQWGVEPAPAATSVDPRVVRAGVVAVIVTLLVPLIVGLRSDGDLDVLTAADTVATTPASVAASTPAPSSTAALDPATLPPAVPRNTSIDAVTDDAASSSPSTSADESEATGASTAALEAGDDTDSAADDSAAAVVAPASADDTAERQQVLCAIEYEIVAGDFWLRIADGAGVPLADVLTANGASSSTPLFAGETICLPAGARVPPPPPSPSTTATTTTTTTTTAPPPPPPPAGPDEIVRIIRDVWPDDLEDRALEIAYRESRYDPMAKNFCCYGLFQIYWQVHDVWLADLGITSAQQLYDPRTNARAAYALYQRAGGWGPWGY